MNAPVGSAVGKCRGLICVRRLARPPRVKGQPGHGAPAAPLSPLLPPPCPPPAAQPIPGGLQFVLGCVLAFSPGRALQRDLAGGGRWGMGLFVAPKGGHGGGFAPSLVPRPLPSGSGDGV